MNFIKFKVRAVLRIFWSGLGVLDTRDPLTRLSWFYSIEISFYEKSSRDKMAELLLLRSQTVIIPPVIKSDDSGRCYTD